MFPISLKSFSDKERHDYILKTFILNKSYTAEQRKHKRDIDVIREHHRFLWEDDDESSIEDSWEVRLARRYYDKLFKEYCIADLSRYKENKIALRWRTEAEVVAGDGQFQCGSRKCPEKEYLRSWEVNFAYQEQGERKNALVKLRLCPKHSDQLNFTSKKREVKRVKHMERKQAKESRREKRKLSKSTKKEQDMMNKECDIDYTSPTKSHGSVIDNGEENNAEELSNRTKDAHQVESETIEDIWSKKPNVEIEPLSRETEFERYLEDLLL